MGGFESATGQPLPVRIVRKGAMACVRRELRVVAVWAFFIASSGCRGAQSMLDPRGPVAAEIETLWWVLLGVCSVGFVILATLFFYAVYRRHDRRPRLPHGAFIIGGGLVLPAAGLITLLVYGTEVGRRIVAEADTPALRIEATGHRFWWEFHYPAEDDAPEVTTANELFLPVGVPVEVTVAARDVIHSFWVPSLAGKLDMIPGHTNVIRLEAGEEGRLRGQCAEYCGAQHARMAFGVAMVSPEAFAAWREARSRPAEAPAEGTPASTGLSAFVDHDCALCHRVEGAIPGSGQGDPSSGIRGPDLTHVAARDTLGARTLTYSRENAAHWIRAHHELKPGSLMPRFDTLPDETVEALADFLDTLR
jgi:cytochrome c oxidase subunit II